MPRSHHALLLKGVQHARDARGDKQSMLGRAPSTLPDQLSYTSMKDDCVHPAVIIRHWLCCARPAAEEAVHHRARSRSNDQRSRVDAARRRDSPGRDRGADRRHRSEHQGSQRSRGDEGARHDRPIDRPPPGTLWLCVSTLQKFGVRG